MLKTTLLISMVFVIGCSNHNKKKPSSLHIVKKPNVVFTITDGIAHPESAIYSSKHKAIFVSNIVSGNPVETKRLGNISMFTPDGKLIASPWIKGLKAPKGMAIVGKFLYVSDVNQVVKIDIKTRKILKTITVAGAKFLNDVVADKKGNIYISDMMTNTIHIWDKDGVSVWLTTPALRSPNGLFTDGKEHLLMTSWGNPIDPNTFATKELGALSALSLRNVSDQINEEKSVRGNLDGITADGAGNLWISDWMNGDVYKVTKSGAAEKVYNFGQGTADITFAKKLNLLLVPQMNESKILAIKLD